MRAPLARIVRGSAPSAASAAYPRGRVCAVARAIAARRDSQPFSEIQALPDSPGSSTPASISDATFGDSCNGVKSGAVKLEQLRKSCPITK